MEKHPLFSARGIRARRNMPLGWFGATAPIPVGCYLVKDGETNEGRTIFRRMSMNDRIQIKPGDCAPAIPTVELGFDVINRVIQDTVEYTTVDQAPRLQGRFVTAILVPKKKKI